MIASCLLLSLALCGPADGPSADVAATVRKLVIELDADEKARRDAAEQKLLDLGAAALPALPADNDAMPAEVRTRLARVKQTLERSQAEAAAQASTVTLPKAKLPLSEVLAALEKQTGNKVVDFREQFGQQANDPAINVDFQQTPFWKALDETLDAAGMTIYNFAGEEGIAIVKRGPSELPRAGRGAYAGAFRIEATEITAHRNFRDPSSHTLELTIDAAWEPRLKPIVVLQPENAIVAKDENGKAIPVAGPGDAVEMDVNPGARSVELPIHFALPDRSVRRIAQLTGKLAALMPGRVEEFRFADLDKGKKAEQKKAGVTVAVDEVRKNNSVWEIRLRVAFDKADNALESHRNWLLNNEVWLEDAAGEKTPYGSLETLHQTESELGVGYLFGVPEGLKGRTLVYRTPVAIMSVPVRFELKDLELP
jgi:hypothetical protein